LEAFVRRSGAPAGVNGQVALVYPDLGVTGVVERGSVSLNGVTHYVIATPFDGKLGSAVSCLVIAGVIPARRVTTARLEDVKMDMASAAALEYARQSRNLPSLNGISVVPGGVVISFM
jgi:hypothetical protein